MKENQPDTEKGQINFVTLEDFRGYIRESLEAKVRTLGIEFVQNLLEEEIDALCGPKGSHKRKQGLAHRGGSERGWVVLNNQRVAIRRPRARNDAGEIPLLRQCAPLFIKATPDPHPAHLGIDAHFIAIQPIPGGIMA